MHLFTPGDDTYRPKQVQQRPNMQGADMHKCFQHKKHFSGLIKGFSCDESRHIKPYETIIIIIAVRVLSPRLRVRKRSREDQMVVEASFRRAGFPLVPVVGLSAERRIPDNGSDDLKTGAIL